MRSQRILDRHLRHWRESGLIDAPLEERLRSASAELEGSRGGNAVRTALGLLGAAFLLSGFVLIVAENWEAIPRGGKLAGWALLHAAWLALTWAFARNLPERPFFAEGFAAVAAGWLLAGIGLVSQIYHLDSRPVNGIWFWLALLLPLAFVLEQKAISAVAFYAAVQALAMEVSDERSWIAAEHADGPWLWIGLPLLAATLALLLPRPATWLRGWVGLFVFGASQCCLLVYGAAHELDDSRLGAAWLVAAPGLLAGLALPQRLLPAAWGAGTARLVLGLSLLPWILNGGEHDPAAATDLLAQGLAWVVQLVAAVLVIRAAAKNASPAWVNLGYLALLFGVMTRYFDFFGHYLEGGLALVFTGLLLLTVLYVLEKARRRTLGGPAVPAPPAPAETEEKAS